MSNAELYLSRPSSVDSLINEAIFSIKVENLIKKSTESQAFHENLAESLALCMSLFGEEYAAEGLVIEAFNDANNIDLKEYDCDSRLDEGLAGDLFFGLGPLIPGVGTFIAGAGVVYYLYEWTKSDNTFDKALNIIMAALSLAQAVPAVGAVASGTAKVIFAPILRIGKLASSGAKITGPLKTFQTYATTGRGGTFIAGVFEKLMASLEGMKALIAGEKAVAAGAKVGAKPGVLASSFDEAIRVLKNSWNAIKGTRIGATAAAGAKVIGQQGLKLINSMRGLWDDLVKGLVPNAKTALAGKEVTVTAASGEKYIGLVDDVVSVGSNSRLMARVDPRTFKIIPSGGGPATVITQSSLKYPTSITPINFPVDKIDDISSLMRSDALARYTSVAKEFSPRKVGASVGLATAVSGVILGPDNTSMIGDEDLQMFGDEMSAEWQNLDEMSEAELQAYIDSMGGPLASATPSTPSPRTGDTRVQFGVAP